MHGEIYTPVVFGNASPSVLSFIGSKVKRMTQKSLPVPGDIFALRSNGDF